MNAITSINEILNLIKSVKELKKGYITNFFLDNSKAELWIKLDLFLYDMIGETTFLYRKNQGFYSLFYIATDIHVLKESLEKISARYNNDLFVIDIIGKQEEIQSMRNIFIENGFYGYTSLVRMSKINNDNSIYEEGSKYISYVEPKNAHKIYDLLQFYFSPYAEQLPLIEEIDVWANRKGILVYCDNNINIQGFLIFELIGKTSYLRYWFVHPDHRDKKIGSALLNRYFVESRYTKRQLFWVIESNGNAIKRYEHYGFKKEQLFDCIMINKNISYGG
jgi:ribosomal protein S18 acetylase RimI-like enzyme